MTVAKEYNDYCGDDKRNNNNNNNSEDKVRPITGRESPEGRVEL